MMTMNLTKREQKQREQREREADDPGECAASYLARIEEIFPRSTSSLFNFTAHVFCECCQLETIFSRCPGHFSSSTILPIALFYKRCVKPRRRHKNGEGAMLGDGTSN